jgi:hypothetical protein
MISLTPVNIDTLITDDSISVTTGDSSTATPNDRNTVTPCDCNKVKLMTGLE